MSARGMSGFTLIEVVIAFAILGLSLTALYGAFANALARTRHDSHLREATLIAQSLLSRSGSEVPAGQLSYYEEWQGYRYELTQQQTAVPEAPPILKQTTVHVTAKVSWMEGDRLRDVEMSTLKLAPLVRP